MGSFKIFIIPLVSLLVVIGYHQHGATKDHQPPVGVITIKDALEFRAQGQNVLFVDAREEEEYLEEHIPGAINLSLRDVRRINPEIFASADIVISYCVKDFRGYEVAKAISDIGVKNSYTLKEYGLKGWKSAGYSLDYQKPNVK